MDLWPVPSNNVFSTSQCIGCSIVMGTPFFHQLGHSNLITCLMSFFWKRNSERLQKKKSRLWCPTDESGLEISVRLQINKGHLMIDIL